MKITPQSSNKRRNIILAVILAVVIAGVGIGVYAIQQQSSKSSSTDTNTSDETKSSTDETVNYNPPTDEEIQAGNDTKEQNVNPSTSPGSDPEATSSLAVTANNSGTDIQVRTTIAASVQDGSCSVTLTKGSSTVTKPNVGIQALSGYSTCKGWNIPVSELSSGTWNVKVIATYQSKTAIGTTGVTIP